MSSNSIVPGDQAPSTPSGLSPANGSALSSTPQLSAVFNDLDPQHSGYVNYQVEDAWNQTIVGTGAGPSVLSGHVSAWTPSTLAPGDQYMWDAWGEDAFALTSPTTAVQSFDLPPSKPTPGSPVTGSTLPTASPVLNASGVSSVSPANYEFQVASDPQFSNVVADSGGLPSGTTSWTVAPGALQDGTTYYWRAGAWDPYGDFSGWSSAQPSFTVSLPKLGVSSAWPMWSHGPVSVNEANGNLVVSLPTASYPTTTGSLTYSLTYNSQATSTSSSPGLGTGWTLSAGDGSMSPPSKLIDHSSAYNNPPTLAAAEIVWPDGSSEFYNQVGSSTTYLTASGDGSQLTKNVAADGSFSWTLLDSDGTMYSFGTESGTGVALLAGAQTAGAKAGNGILTYQFNTSGQITQLGYEDTPGSQLSEWLTFTWAAGCNPNIPNSFLCVKGSPDQRTWTYMAADASHPNEITGVHDGTRQLFGLTYNTNGLLSQVQNANDLNPAQASPNYSLNHSLQLVYDGASPARVSCVIDGPLPGQQPSPQPSCAGTSPAPESTWSFGYHPGTTRPTPPRASHYGYLVRNAGPAAYYPLDETSGSTAVDVSGNGNNGTYSGTYSQGQPGALAGSGGGTAVSFGGGTVAGAASSLDLSAGGYNSVAMWINWNGTDDEMPFGFGTSGSDDYDLWMYGGSFGFNSDNGDIYGTSALTPNTWHFVVAEFYNGALSSSKLWVDGVPQNLTQRSGVAHSATAKTSFHISGDPTSSYRFTGSVDEVALYGYALSATQIAAQFAEGRHDPAPVAYYPLDEPTGSTTASDASGNGNNATYSGNYTQGQSGAYSGSGKSVLFSGGTVSGSVPNLNTSAGAYNTVELWVKWDGNSSEMPFGFGSNYDLYFASGYFGFNTGCSDLYGTSAPSANAWHYVVAEFYNGLPQNGAKLWIDGVQQTLSIKLGTPCSQTVSSNFDISGWPHDGNDRMGGTIDEVAIYNKALSPAEITNNYGTNHVGGLRVGAAAGYTTLTQPNQQTPQGASCPANCVTTYYDGLGRGIETVDTLGRISESGYTATGQSLWSEDADGNPSDNLYGGPNNEPSGNSNLAGALLQTIAPDPDGTGPLSRPVTTSRYDERAVGTPTQPGLALNGLAGTYWSGTNLAGTPQAHQTDPSPGTPGNFSLPSGGSWPVTGNSSAQWTGDLIIPFDGDYTFSTVSDGGTRLTVDGVDEIENWTIPTNPPFTASSGSATHLSAGLQPITVSYEHSGNSSQSIALEWSCSDCSQSISAGTPVPVANLAPAWFNQTSTISPAGRLSFSHYAQPELAESDYSLAQVGNTNLITNYTYDKYGRLTGKVMPNGNPPTSANINASGDLSGAGDPTTSQWGTQYQYYGPTDTVAPPNAPDCSGSSVNQGEQLEKATTHGETPTTYVYDAAGNTLARTNGAGTTCSQYNSENRLTSTQAPGDALPTTYSYDPNGTQLTATGSSASYLGEYGHATSNTASRTKTITLTGSPGAGAAVFLRVAGTTTAPGASAVTDSRGNTWTLLKQATATGAMPTSLYASLQNTAPLTAGDVITVSFSTNVTGFAGIVDAFTGVTSLTPDQTATANSSTNTTARNTGTTPTTIHASELQIAAWGINAVETSFTPTSGTSQFHTQYLSNNSQTTSEGEYRFVNATGTYNLNATGGASSKYNGLIVTLPTVAPATVTTYYDEQNRLVDTIDSSGAEAKYSYDPDSNQLSRSAAKGSLASNPNYTTNYSYDSADQLTSETDPASTQSNPRIYYFYYDNRGNLRGTQYPNGTFSWVDTNPDGWTTDQYNRHGTIDSSTTTPPADSNPLADYTYTYDNLDGKRTSETRTSGSNTQTTNYSYDNLGRLSQDTLAGSTNTCRQYTYDLDSNRTQTQDYTSSGCTGTVTTTNYTYNPTTTPGVDELTQIAVGANTTNYTYTPDGQTQTQGTTTYTWDGWSRIKTATVGSNTITYTYDPTGTLISRVSSSPATTLNYLLGDLFETNVSGAIQTSYADGLDGNLASYNGPPTTGSTPTYLYYDAHGNLAAEANNTGTQTGNHTYDPFGAPGGDPQPTDTTAHRFTGRWNKQYDTTTSLILMGARPYDPNTGRFLSVDPIPGGSLNNYDYAGQDPINNYDLPGTDEEAGGGAGAEGDCICGGGQTPEEIQAATNASDAEERENVGEVVDELKRKSTRQGRTRQYTRGGGQSELRNDLRRLIKAGGGIDNKGRVSTSNGTGMRYELADGQHILLRTQTSRPGVSGIDIGKMTFHYP